MNNKKTKVKVKNFYAVLIGINNYKKNSLDGCINDVLEVNSYFKELCEAQEIEAGTKVNWKPVFYLAPLPSERNTIEEKGIKPGMETETEHHEVGHYYSPTRKNIVNAFKHFEQADSENEDYCLLYYSGHGSYVFTGKVLTQDGVPVFDDYEPSKELQTLVCVDSRNEGSRDLLDKELGYLITKTFKDKMPVSEGQEPKKGVHFLAVMDCCHAGSNTRAGEEDANTPKVRMNPTSANIIAAESLEGFTAKGNFFYEAFDEKQIKVKAGGLKHARYINLSAARASESAHEQPLSWKKTSAAGDQEKVTKQSGVFTYALLKTLRAGGAQLNYKELINRVRMGVRSLVDKQIPVLDKTDFRDDNLVFLGNQFVTPPYQYRVGHREVFDGKEFHINVGKINGLVMPSTEKGTATVQLNNDNKDIVEIKEVRELEAILDIRTEELSKELQQKLIKAKIKTMPFPKIKISIGKNISDALANRLKKTWKANTETYHYFEIVPSEESDIVYEIQSIQGKNQEELILVKPASEILEFPPCLSIGAFLEDLEKVGKWQATISLANPSTDIPANDISISVEILEGKPFTSKTLGDLAKRDWPNKHLDPEVIEVRYINDKQPAIKVNIINNSAAEQYWVGCLYCQSDFRITHKYLDPIEIGSLTVPSTNLTYPNGTETIDAIPLRFDPFFHEYGVTEVTAYLIILVSKQFIPPLDNFAQDAIDFGTGRKSKSYRDFDEVEKEDDWFTVKVPIKLSRPLQAVQLEEEEQKAISRTYAKGDRYNLPTASQLLTIASPKEFSATVQTTNRFSASKIGELLEREGHSTRGILPPGSLWANMEGVENIFTRGITSSVEAHQSILEFSRVRGVLNAEKPLKILPGTPLQQDEAILSVGYDVKHDIYLPLGFTNAAGEVIITELPSPTDMMIGSDQAYLAQDLQSTKDIPGSIKLFFHKVVWSKLSGRHDYDKLTLIRPNGDTLQKIVYKGRKDSERTALTTALQKAEGKDILLLAHGFTGDTDDMVEGIFDRTDLHQRFGAVLAFDYENLYTKIPDAAEKLGKMLKDCGLSDKRVTVVGHSMGGLMARSWIEQHGGDELVQKLIQVGTPNGGSSLVELRKKLIFWLTVGINGISFVQKHKSVFAFLSRMLGNPLFNSFRQMSPESEFLTGLNQAENRTDVPYHLIAGDTTEIEAIFDDDDPIWKKLKACFRDRSKFIFADYLLGNEANDMVVRLESMKALPWDFAGIAEPKCDHLRYFENQSALADLEKFLTH